MPFCLAMQSLLAALALVALVTGAAAQGIARLATTADALIASAGFFHGRHVVVEQRIAYERDLARLAGTSKPVYVFWRTKPSGDQGEIRGDFWDLGRIEQGDSRLAGIDFTPLLETVTRGRWPTRDQVYVLLNATMLPATAADAPTLRAIALSPDRYVEREVRVVGRFKGRNLYGELPLALGKGKWDFVIQSAAGAMWVTGVRPRGKGFDLDPGKRVDTGRWVQVTGVVKREGVTTYLDAQSIDLAAEPEQKAIEVELPARPPQPPPQIIFSAPPPDDADVDRSLPVRIQFSRDMDPRTVRERVRLSYVDANGAPVDLRLPAHTVVYNDAAHAIEIRFAAPLERFQRVRVDLLEGMLALDGQPLKPWSMTFTTGR